MVTPDTVRFAIALWLASGAMVRVKGEVAVPSSGASTIALALLTEVDGFVISIRCITPGEVLCPVAVGGVGVGVGVGVVVVVVVVVVVAGTGALVRNPVSFTKAKPDGVPVAVSNCITGTSEEFRRLGPTTY